MAEQYLSDGAKTLGAASWSGSGFGDEAQLWIGEGNQTISGSTLDQSAAATNGNDYLVVSPQFTGTIGSASEPLRFSADFNADSHVHYYAGAGAAWFQPDGHDSEFHELKVSSGGSLNLVGGGTVVDLYHERGTLSVAGAVAVTNITATGGRTDLKYNSTAVTMGRFTSGVHTIERPGTYEIGGDAQVTIDIESGTTSVKQMGGRVTHKRGDVATFHGYAGEWDATRLERSATVGATTGTITAGLVLKQTNLLTVDANVDNVSSGQTTLGSGAVGGGFV